VEIEVKARVSDLDKLAKKLEKLGARFEEEEHQDDFYFKEKGKEREVQRAGSILLRIRHSGRGNFFTLKGLTERVGCWEEYETEVGDADETRKILERMGYSEVLQINKKRRKGELDGFELCLDRVKQLGNYLEVGLESHDHSEKDKIIRFLHGLGIEKKDIEERGYAAILFQNAGVVFEGTG
jgi:adenylate cyclase class 2